MSMIFPQQNTSYATATPPEDFQQKAFAMWHGNLTTIPCLMTITVSKHFQDSDKVQKGHMKQIKQGTCSNKPKDDIPTLTSHLGKKHDDAFPFCLQHHQQDHV